MNQSPDLHIRPGDRLDGTRGVSVVSGGVEAFGMVLTPGQARMFASMMCQVADEVESASPQQFPTSWPPVVNEATGDDPWATWPPTTPTRATTPTTPDPWASPRSATDDDPQDAP